MNDGIVRAGTGGWIFEPWRGVFYPAGLKQADELCFASRKLTSIEINATYYSAQKAESFAKWRAATPEGFKFTVKGSRFCTNRRVLAEGGEAMERFLGQGLEALEDRLGPVLWQFMPTKRFEREDFARFLDLLPDRLAERPLRHAVEVRHESFRDPAFVDLCRSRGVAICCSDHAQYPLIAELTADFAYVRLQRGSDEVETGYVAEDLDRWAGRLRAYADGRVPEDLPRLTPEATPTPGRREVFAFFINEGKVRAPAAAQALLERLAPGT